jgi:gamma-glutamyltranspeptidase/glutathione hydrolase
MQETWRVAKPARTGRGGIVVSQHALASAAGVEILEAGGNAADAAVATALALGIVEPWMSGIGGIGYLVYGDAKTGQTSVVDYGPRAPKSLDPGRYKVLEDAPATTGGFGWPPTEGDRHQLGYESAVTPSAVAGFALALEKFGRKSFAEAIQPALRLAERGLPLDWHTTLSISLSAADLARDPGAAQDFLPGGFPATPSDDGGLAFLQRPALAATYRRLAAAGPADFYTGETARLMLEDLQEGGSSIGTADLGGTLAELVEPLSYEYQGIKLSFPGPLTGAPTVIAALAEIAPKVPTVPSGYPDGQMFAFYARALRRAFTARLQGLGDEAPGGNTTFLAVVDREGNMVALNNTLLSRFGARVVLPKTGILLNNAINWFDPVPGRPNSLAPGKRPLCNMAPLVATRDGKPWFALGACGGRRIISAVTQLTAMLVDYSMSLESAFAMPRLDASTDPVSVDAAMAPEDIEQVRRLMPAEIVPNTTSPGRFAIPSAVMRAPGSGINSGMAHIMSPVAAAIGEAE